MKMTVMKRSGRPFFEAQWKDPVTEKLCTMSTKCINRRDAERFAARLAVQLESGEDGSAVEATWAEFRRRFEAEVFPGMSRAYRATCRVTFGFVEREIGPRKLASLREPQIQKLVKAFRTAGRSEYTVRKHLTNLRVALSWAVRSKLLARMPTIEMPPEPPEANRGRAITAEEFERMIAVTAKVVGEEHAAEWRRLLTGLWLSGFRIGEACKFHWTDESEISVELSHGRPEVRIQAGAEKAKQFRLLPMPPDFARWLLATPRVDRHGYVFNPVDRNGNRASDDRAGRTISEIGQLAGVKVGKNSSGKVKFASAHDFRRAFGLRWAMKVRAPILMQLMRHSSIATTLKFYAHADAQAVAAEIWAQDAPNETPNTDHLDHSSNDYRQSATS